MFYFFQAIKLPYKKIFVILKLLLKLSVAGQGNHPVFIGHVGTVQYTPISVSAYLATHSANSIRKPQGRGCSLIQQQKTILLFSPSPPTAKRGTSPPAIKSEATGRYQVLNRILNKPI